MSEEEAKEFKREVIYSVTKKIRSDASGDLYKLTRQDTAEIFIAKVITNGYE